MLRPSGAMWSRVTSPPRREELRCDGGRGSVGAVGDDSESCEGEARDAGKKEFYVVGLEGGIVFDRGKGCGIGGLDLRGMAEDIVFHGKLDRVGELESVCAEELDAVVAPGIVRGGDDDAGPEAMGAGEECNGGGGDDASGLDGGSGGAEARGEGGGDPGAGLACVATKQDGGLGAGLSGDRLVWVGLERMAEGKADCVDRGGVEG